MCKKSILCVICLLFAVICFSGCTSNVSTESSVQESSEEQAYDYSKTLDNGLKVNLTKKLLDNDLMGIEFSFDCDDANVIVDEESMQTDEFNCYLISKTDDKKILNSGDVPLSENILYFDNVELTDYNLHLECPVSIELSSSYSVNININNSKPEEISLPLNNYIKINDVSVRTGYDKFSDKCVEISFSASENVMFDIQVDKSEISTGAPVGDLTEVSESNYVYTHPITDTEKSITIFFTSIKINDNINCDIEF